MSARNKIFNEIIYISFTGTPKPNFYTVTLLTKRATQVEVAFPNVFKRSKSEINAYGHKKNHKSYSSSATLY